MNLRNAINVLAVTFWVLSQSVMAFAHMPVPQDVASVVQMSDAASHSADMADCSMHVSSDVPVHNHAPTDTGHEHHGNIDCCSASCSTVANVGVPQVETEQVSRVFDKQPVRVLTPIRIGLSTPPPNTIL